jgi:hypothetical protein
MLFFAKPSDIQKNQVQAKIDKDTYKAHAFGMVTK